MLYSVNYRNIVATRFSLKTKLFMQTLKILTERINYNYKNVEAENNSYLHFYNNSLYKWNFLLLLKRRRGVIKRLQKRVAPHFFIPYIYLLKN